MIVAELFVPETEYEAISMASGTAVFAVICSFSGVRMLRNRESIP